MTPSQTKAFFDAVRAEPFGGTLNVGQVAGINAVLGYWNARPAGPIADPRWIAYSLATAWWETGRKMLPVRENGGRPYGNPPAEYWKAVPPFGLAYYGRGLVQLTWYRNYLLADVTLRKMGALSASESLTQTPDIALRPDIAAAVLVTGMVEGWFTGKKLSDFFDGKTNDPVNARRIVNGLDHAAEIAAAHVHFLYALGKGAAA